VHASFELELPALEGVEELRVAPGALSAPALRSPLAAQAEDQRVVDARVAARVGDVLQVGAQREALAQLEAVAELVGGLGALVKPAPSLKCAWLT
jgi:hypothetical protein